ncbi:F510_1955 family glycosylhydrolase [Planococcus sp. YIM B11945]|uniref:F510_1955 family glycosylhydrolase n=1 Tax=Planococcus sp. YIM B11945 TaxID=3435410 RepID=UPI003D7CBC5E
MNKNRLMMMVLAGFLLAGCSSQATEPFEVPFDEELSHVHGMGYAGNNEGIYFASHSGLKIYRDGKWLETADNFHDYMGFSAIDKGFYTSGHPSADSDLPNPLGIQRSLDGGESLENIAFQGETDFHVMAVGYNSHNIILLNPEKNSLLDAGFYKKDGKGGSWESVMASGLEGEVSALAIHPMDSNFVAAATTTGSYLSKDAGESFHVVTEEDESGTAVFFNEDSLYFAGYGTAPTFKKYNLKDGRQKELALPELKQDGIAFIAQNPKDTKELAIFSIQGVAYLSENNAETWVKLSK